MALLHVNFFSEVLGMCMNMDVILPQKTRKQIGLEGNVHESQDGKYPVIYLLHGMSDDHTIWQRRTSIERYASDLGIAVIMPCVHLSFYTDMEFGLKYWTYISEELPEICREFFPNISDKREDTFVAGLSMGGYGAFKLALRRPDRFAAAASLSGALDMAPHAVTRSLENEDYANIFRNIFGGYDQIAGSENDIFAVAKQLKESGRELPKLYMWCGTEDFLYQDNLSCRDWLRELGYDLTYEESAGAHEWKYWDAKIQTVLEWLPLQGK
ncbi:MAG: esterase family protein [Clostridiales bacterium]|nr:esterase family protein [Clostridiales bacterium]